MSVLRIMLGTECNNNCEYCFVKSSKNYLSKKGNADNILKSMEKVEYSSLELIGGEPFHNIDILSKIFEFNNKPVSFFSSGTYNQNEVLELCKKQSFPISFNFSYDGKLSRRNKNNYDIVKNTISLFKNNGFQTNVRWSVNIEDIPYLFEHFIELHQLGISVPIFFPMKYKDYSNEDINLFIEQYNKILDYSIKNRINFMGIIEKEDLKFITNKKDFMCSNEKTILPDGRFTNCYVSYSSFEFDEKLISNNPYEENKLFFQSPKRCDSCINIIQSCNKCIGNLREYQIKSGNKFFNSYCNLMNALGKTFIEKRIQYNPYSRFEFFIDGKLDKIIQFSNDNIKILKYERDL